MLENVQKSLKIKSKMKTQTPCLSEPHQPERTPLLSRMAGIATNPVRQILSPFSDALGSLPFMSGTVLESKDSPVATLQTPNKTVLLTQNIIPRSLQGYQ